MESVETIQYRGFNIEIYQDENALSPEDMGDTGAFLVHYHRDFEIENKLCPQRILAQMLILTARIIPSQYDDDTDDQIHRCLHNYHFFPVATYIHSGVVLSLCGDEFPDQRWDVSHVGGYFCAKSEWPKRADALKHAQAMIERWNDYLSGGVFGYNIEDVDDSCWGFYGHDHAKSGLLESAQGAIDYHIKTMRAEHTRRVKALLKSHAPLFAFEQQQQTKLPYAALSA